MPKDYWQLAANRRKYFEDFAHEMGFDSMSTKDWLKVNPKRLVIRKVSDGLVLWVVVVACIVVTSGVGVVTLHSCLHNTIGSWTSSPLQELIASCATRYLP